MKDLFPLILKFNGLIIAGSSDITVFRGTRSPRYVFIIQWSNPVDFHNYNEEGYNTIDFF